MARSDYWQYLVDRQGRPLQEAEVRVYLAGTSTEANIFSHPEFGSYSLSSELELKTNKYGFVQFWIGDQWEIEGGYDVDQKFKVVWQNTVDGIQEEIDNLLVFAAVRPIVLSSYTNKDLDKVISNKQGHKWETHVNSVVPSASPHDLEPVVFFNLDTRYNKVVSNKLGYQMYEMARTASTTDVDVSAARFYSEQVTTWTSSGGAYYKEIRHNFNNYYPIVKVFTLSGYQEIRPKRVESVNPNWTRVWLASNKSVRIAFFG